MSQPWSDEALPQHLAALTDMLQRNQIFWREHAFKHRQLPWEPAHPQLSRQLCALTFERIEHLAADSAALADFLREFISDTDAVMRSVDVPAFSPLQDFAALAAARDVPGRKWRQIIDFASAMEPAVQPLLEWCAGKAHLGRLLAQRGATAVTALEWNAELVAQGRRLAQREQLPVSMQQIDVMSAPALAYIESDQRVVALHACGDLHIQLLHGCVQRKPLALVLAPCCYQLTREHRYRPLSQTAAQSGLILSREDLRTAVQGSVTSPQRVQKQRKQLQAWRLGFDLLQRDLRKVDDYLPTPSLPPSVLHAGFIQFCRQLAQQKQLSLPAALDYARYEVAGAERLQRVAAFDLPRILFRRALEIWLLLDRALLMREAGYAVQVGTFCAPELTPRNLLIKAWRR